MTAKVNHTQRLQGPTGGIAGAGGLLFRRALTVRVLGGAETDCWVQSSIKGKLNVEMLCCVCIPSANLVARKSNGRKELERERERSEQAGPSAETGLS